MANNLTNIEGPVDRSDGHCQRRQPFLIAVAGGTASGKSTVCKKIVELLDQHNVDKLDQRVDIISQESFYRELDEKERVLAAKGCFDFDHPSAFDDKLMAETLQNIKSGLPVKIPKYDFVKNSRDTENEQTVNPADVILVEGILVFYFKEIRDMFNMKLFVDTDADTRLSRRVMRDINEHKRPLEQILNQYTKFVKPAFEEFCLPTKKYADVIIPRGADNTVAIDLIVQHIRDLFNSKHGPHLSDLPRPQSAAGSVNSIESLRSFSSIEDKDFKYTSAH